jgi:hypothetical protein
VNALAAAAADMQSFCQQHGWSCTIIGGLAVQRWGEPRQTRDVDVTLLTGLGGEEQFVDPLLARYVPRLPDARRFALERRVLLVETRDRIPIDVSLGGLPFEERVVARSSLFEFEPEVSLRTCSAEDLIVLKAFADRPQDWIDVEGIVVRQGSRLERDAVFDELLPLLELKDDRAPEGRLRRLFAKHRP